MTTVCGVYSPQPRAEVYRARLNCNFIISIWIWQAPWAGKMNQILCCYWLPERARWSYLPHKSPKKNFPESQIINPLLAKLVWWRWLDINLLFCEVMDVDSVRVHKHAKENLVNIQPSWPHTHNPYISEPVFFQVVKNTLETSLLAYQVTPASLSCNVLFLLVVSKKSFSFSRPSLEPYHLPLSKRDLVQIVYFKKFDLHGNEWQSKNICIWRISHKWPFTAKNKECYSSPQTQHQGFVLKQTRV